MTAIQTEHQGQILTVAQMVRAEERLIANGISVDELMQRAGHGAAQWVWRIGGNHSYLVLCGPGNNGGDGYVIAEWLRQKDVPVTVVTATEPKTAAAQNAKDLFAGEIGEDVPNRHFHVFVDCLFGSGLTRQVSGHLKHLLDAAYAQSSIRVAVDVPSGVESDTGALLGTAGPYDLCIALGAWKYAHFLMPASSLNRSQRLVDIGVGNEGSKAFTLPKPIISPPSSKDHKYSRGKVLVIGGKMVGAAVMAAEAAQASGAGYVALAGGKAQGMLLPPDIVDQRSAQQDGVQKALQDKRIKSVLLGPGLGRDDNGRRTLEHVLTASVPVVLDADALHLLTPQDCAEAHAPMVLTPHAGEFDELCRRFGLGRSDMSKVEATRKLAMAANCVVVHKGPDTVIAEPDGSLWINSVSSSWLSVAGTGDVLAGCLGGRVAVTGDVVEAAKQAVWLHGRSGQLARPGFAASQLPEYLRMALEECL